MITTRFSVSILALESSLLSVYVLTVLIKRFPVLQKFLKFNTFFLGKCQHFYFYFPYIHDYIWEFSVSVCDTQSHIKNLVHPFDWIFLIWFQLTSHCDNDLVPERLTIRVAQKRWLQMEMVKTNLIETYLHVIFDVVKEKFERKTWLEMNGSLCFKT